MSPSSTTKTTMTPRRRAGSSKKPGDDVRCSSWTCVSRRTASRPWRGLWRSYGKLDILVNNAAFQMAQKNFEDISEEQLRRSFETNIFGYFFMAQAALPHLEEGAAIINTGSIVGLTGIPILIDYSSTKGAIHAFTKSLALNLGPRGIRVNCVVPGPVWTPNIPGTMPIEEIENFGHEVALGRPGQPEELAPAYVLLASSDGSFMTGALVEVTGGRLSSAS